jgi:hypothetical protein
MMPNDKLDPQQINWERVQKNYEAMLRVATKPREERLNAIKEILRKAREEHDAERGRQ